MIFAGKKEQNKAKHNKEQQMKFSNFLKKKTTNASNKNTIQTQSNVIFTNENNNMKILLNRKRKISFIKCNRENSVRCLSHYYKKERG